MGDLERALSDCEALLEQERVAGADEALVAAKEAAVQRLGSLVPSMSSLSGSEWEALSPRIRAVLVANRYNLKWSALRAKLSQIGQPKPAAPAQPRPRVDLVH